MITNFRTLEMVAAAVLLPGAMTIPAIAGEPVIPNNVASDAAPPMKPADATTPTTPANDVDDLKVTAQIKVALARDTSLSPQAHEISVATNQQAVILRGSVTSADKDRINTLAGQYAGARQVIDELLVRDL
jgi:osmotically-inducible protein OsmY